MTVITVRLSKKEKSSLKKYGRISDVVRQAIRMYLNDMNAMEALRKLEQYQKKNPMSTTSKEIVAMLRKDRDGFLT